METKNFSSYTEAECKTYLKEMIKRFISNNKEVREKITISSEAGITWMNAVSTLYSELKKNKCAIYIYSDTNEAELKIEVTDKMCSSYITSLKDIEKVFYSIGEDIRILIDKIRKVG